MAKPEPLPIPDDSSQTSTPKEESEPESQLILLLDDDEMLTDVVARGLERDGRTTITCNDLESAELMVERLHPSHVVADVQLSGPFAFEGLDFIHYVKRHAPESRIIVISDDAPEALQMEASVRGAVAFLRKPFEISELNSTIDLMAASEKSARGDYGAVIRMPLLDEILSSDLLIPFFQPIVQLHDQRAIAGYESLARYRSEAPIRNPDVLFEYADRKHRLAELEIACITGTLRSGSWLSRQGPLFMNVHPKVFSAGAPLRDALLSQADRTGVPPTRIVLEITEQAPLDDAPIVLKIIRDLQDAGIRFAFDDLGLAYSHLPLIDTVRPSYLKVSQHFGTRFESDETKRKIITNLLSLARDFHAELILEGVEDESTADAAAAMGIPLAQGFFFGRPAEAQTYERRTSTRPPARRDDGDGDGDRPHLQGL